MRVWKQLRHDFEILAIECSVLREVTTVAGHTRNEKRAQAQQSEGGRTRRILYKPIATTGERSFPMLHQRDYPRQMCPTSSSRLVDTLSSKYVSLLTVLPSPAVPEISAIQADALTRTTIEVI